MNKKTVLFLFVAVISAVALVYYSKSLVTPYVTLKEAKMSHNAVQVVADRVTGDAVAETPAGILMKVKDLNGNEFSVFCTDRTARERISLVERVVVVGKFNPDRNVFVASAVLTKCPSKYVRKTEQ